MVSVKRIVNDESFSLEKSWQYSSKNFGYSLCISATSIKGIEVVKLSMTARKKVNTLPLVIFLLRCRSGSEFSMTSQVLAHEIVFRTSWLYKFPAALLCFLILFMQQISQYCPQCYFYVWEKQGLTAALRPWPEKIYRQRWFSYSSKQRKNKPWIVTASSYFSS